MTTVDPITALAKRVRATLAEGERLAKEHGVELGQHDDLMHGDVLQLLAVVDAAAGLRAKAEELEGDAAARDPDGTAALQLNSRARGLRDAADHIAKAVAAAQAEEAGRG